jgi:multidrug efflux system outer membrane protein
MPTAFKESQAPEAAARDAVPVKTAADGSTWKQAQPAEAQPRGEWWLAFNDPALNELINEATRANANLAVAAARVKQARAIAGIAEADRIPQVGIAAGAQRVRQSDVELGLPAGTPVAPAKVFNANLTASYEVDLFGRVSSNVAAARGDAARLKRPTAPCCWQCRPTWHRPTSVCVPPTPNWKR